MRSVSAGDVNGDGFGDVFVVRQHSPTSARADLYFGSILGLGNSVTWAGTSSAEHYNTSVAATAGDVNGDGYDDVILTGPPRIYLGSPSGPTAQLAWTPA